MRLTVLTMMVLVAFAANSLLCRMALSGDGLMDPAGFTAVRLVSGAAALWLLVWMSVRSRSRHNELQAAPVVANRGSWWSALALLLYAAGFSFAYIWLDTGMGALILFGAVQVTMLGWAVWRGEAQSLLQWVGAFVALGGLVYLVLPGLTAPDPTGAALMALAGVGWGIYSIRGRGATTPMVMTADNFLLAAPLTVVLTLVLSMGVVPQLWMQQPLRFTSAGVALAVTSGAVTSGLGYALWYRVLPALGTNRAAVVQLTVPLIAAVAGVLMLDEVLTWRLAQAGVLIIGGVALAMVRR